MANQQVCRHREQVSRNLVNLGARVGRKNSGDEHSRNWGLPRRTGGLAEQSIGGVLANFVNPDRFMCQPPETGEEAEGDYLAEDG